MRKTNLYLLLLMMLVALSLTLLAQSQKKTPAGTEPANTHLMLTPDQLKWEPAGAMLPAGAEAAVLEGDPTKAGSSFTIRTKMPDGYRIPPHWHPTDENIVVLQGSFGMGFGDKFDEAAGHEMPVGSYMKTPKGQRHYAWAKGETIIQVYGTGPFEITYVNPADDPRQKASAK